ncbi:MAG: ribose 5-phosphate isomerase B [Verrucomicrobiota bacterium]|nr:ribose 5-phosphate isomerase B [Verrucomicrobiota bacterium]
MKISIGADHGGLELREHLVKHLKAGGHEVIDHGAFTTESVDYPDYSAKVGGDVAGGAALFGVLICTTGIGIGIAANKIRGIRAALVTNEDAARLCRQHNNANIICLGQRHTTKVQAALYLDIFINSTFDGTNDVGVRHTRRLGKISSLESANNR